MDSSLHALAVAGIARPIGPCDLEGRPRLLDLFCCEGGAGMGYHLAGFEVVGVDISPSARYPFACLNADALSLRPEFLATFDAIHASPPCQAHTMAQRIRRREHPNLIAATRAMLETSGLPFVIENVPGAPLLPERTIRLCGRMFPGLRVYRHRDFECNFPVTAPYHPLHDVPQAKMGRPVPSGDFIQVVGNFSGVDYARNAMRCDWMSRDGLREAVPPAYTQHIGDQLLNHIRQERLAA